MTKNVRFSDIHQTRIIPKEESLQDKIANIRRVQDHLLYTLTRPIASIIKDLQSTRKLLRNVSSVSPQSPKSFSPLRDHELRKLKDHIDNFFLDASTYYEKFIEIFKSYGSMQLHTLIHNALNKPIPSVDYFCAMILLRIALEKFAKSSGCTMHCNMVAKFKKDEYELVLRSVASHKSPIRRLLKDLKQECIQFYTSLVDILQVDDLRTFDEMLREATSDRCRILSYQYIDYVTNDG